MDQKERLFKALSDPLRLKILQFLRNPGAGCCVVDGRVCACDLERIVGVSQATVSHHMRLLVEAGLVRAEKRGRWMHYTVERQAFVQLKAWVEPFASEAGQ